MKSSRVAERSCWACSSRLNTVGSSSARSVFSFEIDCCEASRILAMRRCSDSGGTEIWIVLILESDTAGYEAPVARSHARWMNPGVCTTWKRYRESAIFGSVLKTDKPELAILGERLTGTAATALRLGLTVDTRTSPAWVTVVARDGAVVDVIVEGPTIDFDSLSIDEISIYCQSISSSFRQRSTEVQTSPSFTIGQS